MSAKNLDSKGRFRARTIGFRVSPEEDQLINSAVALSGRRHISCSSSGACSVSCSSARSFRETNLIRSAKNNIVLIDNFIDDTVLKLLDKHSAGVKAMVYTRQISLTLQNDINLHNAQYEPIEVNEFAHSHDRFLMIDETVYHIGASMKDLGKKWFAFSKMEITSSQLLSKM